jgi:RHS repeat-associated protein
VFTETKYDNLGRVIATSNPYRSGETIYWSKPRYDELNRVVETYAPAIEGQTGASLGITEFGISTVQDFVGTYTTATDASGRRARSITNALGQLIRIDEPTGNNELGSLGEPNQSTFYKYNSQGKMVKVSQGQQNRLFLYDYLGRLIRVRQPEQEVNSALDLTDTVTNNNQWTAGFEYNIVGNLKKTTDAKGSIITNSYDKAGRVTLREYNNLDTPSVYYYYDGTGLGAVPDYSKGKLTKVMSSISTTQYTSFDNFGRNLISQQLTDGQTYESKYKYDFGGRMVEQTYPSGKVVRNFFENDGDLAKVVRNGKTYVSDFSYNASGGINSLKLGNGLWETAQFNTRQQLTQLGLGANANDSSLFKLQYEFGELTANGTIQNTGNITKQTITLPNASFVQTYKYDALDRLTEAKETNGTSATENWKQTFGYDRFGNRTGFSQQINNQALTINSQTLPSVNPDTNRFNLNQGFEYDKSGNVIKDIDRVTGLQRSFTFNAENKQVHVKDANNAPVGTYYYDGNGNRVKKTTATETTIFVYDGSGKMVAEYSTQQSANPTVSYLTTDHLGTPRVITDKNGNVISRRDMMPFGEDLYAGVGSRTGDNGQKYSSSLDDIRQKFTGYPKDKETNLDFAEARYYNNLYGRFTAVDPLLASGKSMNPQTFNRYVYTMNQPIRKTDKSGLIPDWYEKDGTYNWSTDNKTFDKGGESTENWQKVSFGGWDYKMYQGCTDASCSSTKLAILYKNENDWDWVNSFSQFWRDAKRDFASWSPNDTLNEFRRAFSYNSFKHDYNQFMSDPLGDKALGSPALGALGVEFGAIKSFGTASRAVKTVTAGEMLAANSESRAAQFIQKVLCCFVAGTPIHTIDGLKPIEQIKVGDKVLSYDEKTKQLEYKTVVSTFFGVKTNIVKLKIDGEKATFTTTNDHPFYIKARGSLSANEDKEGEWKTAEFLKVGDKILNLDGKWTRILEIERETKSTLVYNFEVEDNHNYFVGEVGFLSHNCNIGNIISTATQGLCKLGKCTDFANAAVSALKNKNVRGELIEISSVNQYDQIISTTFTNANGVAQSVGTQLHQGVRVGSLVYDNLNPSGIAYDIWIKSFAARSGLNAPTVTPF